jgi:hypothetical protein
MLTPHMSPQSASSVALTGTNAGHILLLGSVLSARHHTPWIVWDATCVPPPDVLHRESRGQLLTFQACVYAAECQLLTTRRILDRTNSDHIWIVECDDLKAKDLPMEFPLVDADVVLGPGYSRFSRKALEHISRDFGMGLDYSGLVVHTLDQHE